MAGTKIIYDRNKLMQLRNSPLAKTPPANLPNIAGITRSAQHQQQHAVPLDPRSDAGIFYRQHHCSSLTRALSIHTYISIAACATAQRSLTHTHSLSTL